jgi:hypothetical protein
MDKDIMYTLDVYKKNIYNIEKNIKENFNVKFLAYDQYELKVYFMNELSDKEEELLFQLLEKFEN